MRSFRPLALIVVAWAGSILGHLWGEAVIAPPGHRTEAMTNLTGTQAIIALLPAGLALLTTLAIRSRTTVSVTRTAAVLASVQVPLCFLMGIAGLDPVHAGPADPATWATLAIQVIVAAATAMVLAMLVAGARLIVASLRRSEPPRARSARFTSRPSPGYRPRDLLVRCRRRAPPILLTG